MIMKIGLNNLKSSEKMLLYNLTHPSSPQILFEKCFSFLEILLAACGNREDIYGLTLFSFDNFFFICLKYWCLWT